MARTARTVRVGLLLAAALPGCNHDWARFQEGDDDALSSLDLGPAGNTGGLHVSGTFVGGAAGSSGGRYQLSGRLLWRAGRQSGRTYTVEGGLR